MPPTMRLLTVRLSSSSCTSRSCCAARTSASDARFTALPAACTGQRSASVKTREESGGGEWEGKRKREGEGERGETQWDSEKGWETGRQEIERERDKGGEKERGRGGGGKRETNRDKKRHTQREREDGRQEINRERQRGKEKEGEREGRRAEREIKEDEREAEGREKSRGRKQGEGKTRRARERKREDCQRGMEWTKSQETTPYQLSVQLLQATHDVTVSTSAFLACHQCYCAGSSLAWGLNFRVLVRGIFWSWSPGVFSGYSGFLPSFTGLPFSQ